MELHTALKNSYMWVYGCAIGASIRCNVWWWRRRLRSWSASICRTCRTGRDNSSYWSIVTVLSLSTTVIIMWFIIIWKYFYFVITNIWMRYLILYHIAWFSFKMFAVLKRRDKSIAYLPMTSLLRMLVTLPSIVFVSIK